MAEETKPSSGLDATIPASSPPEAALAAQVATSNESRYRLGAELGRGGMGRVVEAFDTQLGRTVALKEVLPTGSANVARRFLREVQITARLEHASIVPLYDAGTTSDGRAFYVMRRVGGRPLDELISRARGLAERLALLPNVLAAADAIGHAHKRGVIHRDLKPANILVGELGETVVIDWGLAKVIGETDPDPDSVEPSIPSAADSLQTHVGAVFGTPGFMAPEQARGEELDQRGDVFALGATLYQLLAGKPPVSGSSATEMLASTMKHEIIPISTACPEAPAELVTIIDKALEARPADRYANAGELAEDVRRFLTGQLVAAHRYTRRQRLARFARKHRGALAVAALASLAVAVLSWVSVHRVLSERDAANAAREEADVQRRKADAKTAEVRQRADQLLVAHARSLVDKNPTQAVGVLKQLESAAPDVIAEAKAVAKSAIMRGAARGVPSLVGMTLSFEMTRDGKRVLQVSRSGQLQVIDLDLRRPIATLAVAPFSHGLWVDGDRQVLIESDSQPPQLLDPGTGKVASITSAPLGTTSKSARGDVVAYIDERHHVGVIDIATRTTKPLWTTGNARSELAMAPDGSYIAFGEKLDLKRARLVVIDRDGKVLVEREGDVMALAVSSTGTLVASFYDAIYEVKPAVGATFTRLPIEAADARTIHWMVFRGGLLDLFSFRQILTWTGKTLVRSETISDGVYAGTEAAAGVLVATANDNAVHLLRGGVHLTLPLTAKPDGPARVATAAGITRIAATSGDAILVWDLADLLPTFIDAPTGFFIDDHHLLVTGALSSDWVTYDVSTGATKPSPVAPLGLARSLDASTDDGRVLAIVMHGRQGSPQGAYSATILDQRTDRRIELGEVDNGLAVLVPGEGVIVGGAKGRVLGRVGEAPPKQLVQLDGDVQSIAACGRLGFAALGRAGDLVKGSLDGGTPERVRIDIDAGASIVCDESRSVVIATGNRLLRWRGTVREVARFPDDSGGVVLGLRSNDTGVFVDLANKDIYVLVSGDSTTHRLPITGPNVIGDHGRLIAGISPTMQLELVDLPSRAKWTLPRLFSSMPQLTVSSDGRLLAQVQPGALALWRLPQAGTDYGLWLDEVTNATEADGHVVWPWQKPP